ncbi:hypothetical protein [Rubrolithibacter danxiaensis]|uniref:hypothetical protein n=1 Tax=Rubrolithibacter danxiaensis TaxID=3390805 RepID=UPI003BF788ED
MNKKEILRKIGGILSELTEQYQYLSANPDSLNELELELFVANSNFLADHLQILKKINSTEEIPSKGLHIPFAAPAEIVEEKLPEPEFFNQPEEENSNSTEDVSSEIEYDTPFLKEEAETDIEELPENEVPVVNVVETSQEDEKITDEAIPAVTTPENEHIEETPFESKENVRQTMEDAKEETPVEEQKVFELPPVIHNEQPKTSLSDINPDSHSTLSEQQSPVKTINDLISAQRKASTGSSYFNRQPASADLKSSISLNDKLLFIKDLFNGYSLAYSEAIELLNRFDTLEAADKFLKTNYSEKNNWAAKQTTVNKFYEILNRRFVK